MRIPPLRRGLVLRLAVLAAGFAGLAAGDWANVPLWPMDLIRPLVLVELWYVPEAADAADWRALANTQGGVLMRLRTASRRPLGDYPDRRYLVDGASKLKVVLPPGRYLVWAGAAGVLRSHFTSFATAAGHGYRAFDVRRGAERQVVQLAIASLPEADDETLVELLDTALLAGDLEQLEQLAALVLARGDAPGAAAGPPSPDSAKSVARRAELVARAVRAIDAALRALDELPSAHYSSRLNVADQLLAAANALYSGGASADRPRTLRRGTRFFSPELLRDGVLQARNDAIRTAARSIQGFFAARAYVKGLAMWYWLQANREMIPVAPSSPTPTPDDSAGLEATATATEPAPTAAAETAAAVVSPTAEQASEPTLPEHPTEPVSTPIMELAISRPSTAQAEALLAELDAAAPDDTPVAFDQAAPEELLRLPEDVAAARTEMLRNIVAATSRSRSFLESGDAVQAGDAFKELLDDLRLHKGVLALPLEQRRDLLRQADDLDLVFEANQLWEWQRWDAAIALYRRVSIRPEWLKSRLQRQPAADAN
ncbi:MAG: hypothetical protein HYV63_02830 [Candidatus Schekmanbacteria bacterium]|nr:hypothetical protein [Candidatus Schekmanbacteria bacterium]